MKSRIFATWTMARHSTRSSMNCTTATSRRRAAGCAAKGARSTAIASRPERPDSGRSADSEELLPVKRGQDHAAPDQALPFIGREGLSNACRGRAGPPDLADGAGIVTALLFGEEIALHWLASQQGNVRPVMLIKCR